MNIKQLTFGLLTIGLISCNSTPKEKSTEETESYSDIKIVGAMKNVMWKGELGSSIDLDTISDKNGLYGLGPVSYLTGELLINNGKSYVSKVTSDSTMTVEKTFNTSAPFFVYGNVTEWNEIDLPSDVKTIQEVEKLIDDKTTDFKRPFAFKLIGQVSSAIIHIQNLPEGTKVSSPDEAHQGQMNYNIENEEAEIVGFFSTEHKGVFTHHDSFLHMHLITKDESKMGHLDELEIGKMKLYLPKKYKVEKNCESSFTIKKQSDCKLEFYATEDVSMDSFIKMVEISLDTIFDRNIITQNQFDAYDSIKVVKYIPIYSPTNLDYFEFDKQLCDEASILRIAFFCHNIMTNGNDYEINTSELEISKTHLDSVIKYFNTNKWIGQCGEYDAFARKVYEYYDYETITVNPTLFGDTEPLGHIYTIVYSPYSELYYPIDIQNNCYWKLNNGQIADFNSIIKGVNHSREYIDMLNGRKNILLKSIDHTPVVIEREGKIEAFPLPGMNKEYEDVKSVYVSPSGTELYYRSIIKPNEDNTPYSYMDRTSKILNKDSPSWEDFIFKAGIFNESEKINKRLFYGENQRLNNFWESIK